MFAIPAPCWGRAMYRGYIPGYNQQRKVLQLLQMILVWIQSLNTVQIALEVSDK
jgi:hypothetical protein